MPHEMPDGLELTVPLPVPLVVTLRVCRSRVKVAVTVVDETRVTTHVPVPEHPPPDHPVNVEPVAGEAESVGQTPPLSRSALQRLDARGV